MAKSDPQTDQSNVRRETHESALPHGAASRRDQADVSHDVNPSPQASEPANDSAEQRRSANQPASKSDWGLSARKEGMTRETKIGMLLILVLVCAFAFVVYRKFENRDDLLEESIASKTDHGHKSEKSAANQNRQVKPYNNDDDHSHETAANQPQAQKEPPIASGEHAEHAVQNGTQEPRRLNTGQATPQWTLGENTGSHENNQTGNAHVHAPTKKNPFEFASQSKSLTDAQQQQPGRIDPHDQSQQTFRQSQQTFRQSQQTFRLQPQTEFPQGQAASSQSGFGSGEAYNPFANNGPGSSAGTRNGTSDTTRIDGDHDHNHGFPGKTISLAGTTPMKKESAVPIFGDHQGTTGNPDFQNSPRQDGTTGDRFSTRRQPAPARQTFGTEPDGRRQVGFEQNHQGNGQTEQSQTGNLGKRNDSRFGSFSPGKSSSGQAKSATVVWPKTGTANLQDNRTQKFGSSSQSGSGAALKNKASDSDQDWGKNEKIPSFSGRQPANNLS
ncbi:MAG: hypothetical protein IID45_12635, partial [Planctomycetes bacterium]|nr:hypothetical protein [Planctomycetota bacterium]